LPKIAQILNLFIKKQAKLMEQTPYSDRPISEWQATTEQLLAANPLDQKTLVAIVLNAWQCILDSKICELQIGKDFFPNPQMMGYFIETLTAIHLSERFPMIWRHGKEKDEKDVICLTDDAFSIEIKSSSSPNKIFGNRSYAQEQTDASTKSKSGYYLAINFEKFNTENPLQQPKIRLIRLGYLEHTDWRGQISAKGQKANLAPDAYRYKFITLYENK
jgi:hypothetical protein